MSFSFDNIFSSNFINAINSVTLFDATLAMILALFLGSLIYITYKKTFIGVMYSTSFGATLVALTMITTLIMLAVTSNVVLSLGMVGALSIVRFRSAIKDPMDIAFIFWAIADGIVLAAGLIPLAVFGSIVISITILLFNRIKSSGIDIPYILVIQMASDKADKCESKVIEVVESNTKRYMIKSKTMLDGTSELTLDIRLIDKNKTEFIGEIKKITGVRSVVLVTYNGQYQS